jgi:hypothetical protein
MSHRSPWKEMSHALDGAVHAFASVFVPAQQAKATPPAPAHSTAAAHAADARRRHRSERSVPLSPAVRLNPSLRSVGEEVVAQIPTRFLHDAALASEHMQHAQLQTETIRKIISALYVEQTAESLRGVFEIFDASGDGNMEEDEFLALLSMLGPPVPPQVCQVGSLPRGHTFSRTYTLSRIPQIR